MFIRTDSHDFNVSWESFVKFQTNVHLDQKTKWLEFLQNVIKDKMMTFDIHTVTSEYSAEHISQHHSRTDGEIITYKVS